ncbi:hypothetical protein, partial [Mesorhizobium sp. M7A.F.Ca.US.005.03.2.1]|uniref:hypothetical protein n=1 Tax=Mesorhizobium sp. M7A.F.Ca.US.005.03.2.1 TaxID=2496737 RepID=UPI0019D1B2C8
QRPDSFGRQSFELDGHGKISGVVIGNYVLEPSPPTRFLPNVEKPIAPRRSALIRFLSKAPAN